ncbi:MAG: 50S ribosomal protein L20 [Prevotella sp.]|nr:50S ribosomal protein L20 [Prevotella sp.]
MELDNIRGVGDAAIGHLGNVDETVLMDANIDKGAEVGDVGDDAARQEGLSYSVFMGNLAKAGIEINRKVLADLAINNPEAFKVIVEKVK